MNRPASPPPAQAAFHFARAPDGVTYLARQHAGYPFHITRPFHLERDPPGMATLYLQSVSGGIYADDRLRMSVDLGPGAAAQVTTQASTIVHAAAEGAAEQTVRLVAGADSTLEYLPDPMILFPAAALTTRLSVTLGEGASVIVTDAFLDHDPAGAGRVFTRLASETRFERPDGTLLAADRFEIDGPAIARGEPGIMGAGRAQGTVFALTPGAAPAALAEALRAALEPVAGLYAGASVLPGEGGAWARMLAPDGATLTAGLRAAWVGLRRLLTGQDPLIRRK